MMTPRPHQREAIDSIAATLAAADRAQYLAACGTGKTLVSIETAKHLDAQLTVVVAPNLSLLAQLERSWRRQWPGIGTSFVCGPEGPRNGTEPETLVQRRGVRVLFSTLHSLHRVAALLREAGTAADLMVVDEAHHLAGSGSRGADALDPQFPVSKRLFMTATPRLGESDENGQFVPGASMDDTSLFGEVADELGFGAAIQDGLIADYRIVVLGTSDEEVSSVAEDDEDARLAAAVIAAKRLQESGVRHQQHRPAPRRHRARGLELFHPDDAPPRGGGGVTAEAREIRYWEAYCPTCGVTLTDDWGYDQETAEELAALHDRDEHSGIDREGAP